MQKVLIAEDEKDIRDLIGFTLKLAGFETVFASNGHEAVSQAAAELPDIILMDLHMPGMEGDEAAKVISEKVSTKKIPVVYLTARDANDQICGQIAKGADFIAKPFAIDGLTRKIKEVLGRESN